MSTDEPRLYLSIRSTRSGGRFFLLGLIFQIISAFTTSTFCSVFSAVFNSLYLCPAFVSFKLCVYGVSAWVVQTQLTSGIKLEISDDPAFVDRTGCLLGRPRVKDLVCVCVFTNCLQKQG